MHKAAFTPDNAAMLLIDHQIGTMAWTHSHDINLVKQNALKLARIAKAAGLPTVLTASMEERVQGPLVPELRDFAGSFRGANQAPGHRQCHASRRLQQSRQGDWPQEAVRGRLTTEICVTFPVLQMLDEGYEVQVSADASASYTKYGDDIALRRMEKAGAILTTVDQIISELAIDWTSPLGQKLVPILGY